MCPEILMTFHFLLKSNKWSFLGGWRFYGKNILQGKQKQINKIILMGNRQTNKMFTKIKSFSVLDTFPVAGCSKSSKFEKVMIVQTHGDDRENGGFFLFCTKLLFFWKNKKNPPFPLSSPCVWTIITFLNLELLVQPADKKVSKIFKLFICLRNFVSLSVSYQYNFVLLTFVSLTKHFFVFALKSSTAENTCFFDLSKKWFLTKIGNHTCCMNKKICGKFK